MIIATDCDETILDSSVMVKRAYLDLIDPAADIPDHSYSSKWFTGGDVERQKENWQNFIKLYAQSPYFTMAAPVKGAVAGIRKLKTMGHTLIVLSAIGDEPDALARRRRHLESLVGPGVFDDVICTARFGDKGKRLAETGAEVLIDDGPANTTRAIECGVRGIWFHCPENDHIVKAVMSGGKDAAFPGHFWPFDAETLRNRAIVADNWPDVVKIIAGLCRNRK